MFIIDDYFTGKGRSRRDNVTGCNKSKRSPKNYQ
jgi:hypothetical protein